MFLCQCLWVSLFLCIFSSVYHSLYVSVPVCLSVSKSLLLCTFVSLCLDVSMYTHTARVRILQHIVSPSPEPPSHFSTFPQAWMTAVTATASTCRCLRKRCSRARARCQTCQQGEGGRSVFQGSTEVQAAPLACASRTWGVGLGWHQ